MFMFTIIISGPEIRVPICPPVIGRAGHRLAKLEPATKASFRKRCRSGKNSRREENNPFNKQTFPPLPLLPHPPLQQTTNIISIVYSAFRRPGSHRNLLFYPYDIVHEACPAYANYPDAKTPDLMRENRDEKETGN